MNIEYTFKNNNWSTVLCYFWRETCTDEKISRCKLR